ncbi:hypothetical protein [Streptomyces sp. NPDC050263]|uniref:hypothetical protein n=1 Tax=Streptomyces sp. NPDC050263 TaxID=3155037 RepID=UPI00341A1CBD
MKGRTDEAREPTARYDVELPAAKSAKQGAADRWNALKNLFRDGEWTQTLQYWPASFGGLLLVYGVATWLPTLMRSADEELVGVH